MFLTQAYCSTSEISRGYIMGYFCLHYMQKDDFILLVRVHLKKVIYRWDGIKV